MPQTPLTTADLANASGAELRAAIRTGRWSAPTPGLARGYVQTNVVILPSALAANFELFCRRNPRPCPLVAKSLPSNPHIPQAAAEADLRTDVGRYRVFRHGKTEEIEPRDIGDLWRDDLIGFLLGCSFTFERALIKSGLAVRHLEEGRNVPMYRTNIPCEQAGPFAGPLVVSMRPYRPEQVEQVIAVTSQYPQMHGGPIHIGEPSEIGINDLATPDFGEAVTAGASEVPIFWACGVTPQLALENARPELAITHSPGYMFVTDLRDEDYCMPGD